MLTDQTEKPGYKPQDTGLPVMPGHRLTQWDILTLTVTSVKAVDLPGNLT